ncbi:hypothetical protein ASPFODRAFT_54026 [Aspergillus luchuensis CBS 106.47]|uniref:Uncharacterized protein n=1 Tax=Aspergillus luchuensis (strain CBS 106.47) TaxID=1137211 RepID=A0A1M3SZY2_ASPLC|nr:hypothetical protein ASPFODRAFT_54026 [Aspergillus luchuensis CBS 106.47]
MIRPHAEEELDRLDVIMRLSDCDDRLLGSLTAVDRRPSGELDDLQITARANEAGGKKRKGKEMKRKKKRGGG